MSIINNQSPTFVNNNENKQNYVQYGDFVNFMNNVNKEVDYIKQTIMINNVSTSSEFNKLAFVLLVEFIKQAKTLQLKIDKISLNIEELNHLIKKNVTKKEKNTADSEKLSSEVKDFKHKVNNIPRYIEVNNIKNAGISKTFKIETQAWCKSLILVNLQVKCSENSDTLFSTLTTPYTYNYNINNVKSINNKENLLTSLDSLKRLYYQNKKFIITGHDTGEIAIWDTESNSKVAFNNTTHEFPIFALQELSTISNTNKNYKENSIEKESCIFISGDYLKPKCKGLAVIWQLKQNNNSSSNNITLVKLKHFFLGNEGIWCFKQIKLISKTSYSSKNLFLQHSDTTPFTLNFQDEKEKETLHSLQNLIMSKHTSETSRTDSVDKGGDSYFNLNMTNIKNKSSYSIICGMINGKIILLDSEKGPEIFSERHSTTIRALTILSLHLKQYLISASKDNQIISHEIEISEDEKIISTKQFYYDKEHTNGILSLTKLSSVDIKSQEEINNHDISIKNDLTDLDSLFISSANDNLIKIWKLYQKTSIKTIHIHGDSVSTIKGLSELKLFISSSLDKTVIFYDIEEMTVIRSVNTEESINKMVYVKGESGEKCFSIYYINNTSKFIYGIKLG